MSALGTDIKYLRSTFALDDGPGTCPFEAGSDVTVKKLNDDAGLPYHKVVKALDLTP